MKCRQIVHYPDQPLEAERVSGYNPHVISGSQVQASNAAAYAVNSGATYQQAAYTTGVRPAETYTTNTVYQSVPVATNNVTYTTGTYDAGQVVSSGVPVTRTGEWTETDYVTKTTLPGQYTYTTTDANYTHQQSS